MIKRKTEDKTQVYMKSFQFYLKYFVVVVVFRTAQ